MAKKNQTKASNKAGRKLAVNAKKSASPSSTTIPKNRLRKAPQYKHFRVSRRIKSTSKRLPGSFRLLKRSIQTIFKYWKPIGSILLIYAVLNLLLVRGFTGSADLTEVKDILNEALQGSLNQFATGLALFSSLLSSAGNEIQGVAATYQAILVLIMILALVWSLRQLLSGKHILVRDAFYKGMYPLVPFLLVLIVIIVQFLPLAFGIFLFNTITAQGIAPTGLEQFLWAMLVFLFGVLSVYMVSSSIFALCIVTLPDMTPMKALRSARQLVLYRRWTIMRKIVFLPIALVVIAFVLTMPFLIWLTPVAAWVFFVFSISSLAVTVTYVYSLYRELL